MATKTKKPSRKRTAAKAAPAKRTKARATTARPKAARPAKRAPAPKRAAVKAAAAGTGRPARRAIFIDVENTSSEHDLFDVIEKLQIDRSAQAVELTAVGNWRAVGQKLGRSLAALGAQLVHSAPALGVRDWSDLWIAVAAGCWLGRAEPGDLLDIVSNDRAFDAVGDAAAARGVVFRRLQHRRGATAAAHAAAASDEERPARRSRRGGRRRRRGTPSGAPSVAAHGSAPHGGTTSAPPAPSAPPRQPHMVEAEPHGAPREQMLGVIGRLSGGDSNRWVNLDVLEKALKAEGFARPPGSPRLVTRLRMLKDVEIDSHGRVRLAPGAVVAVEAPTAEAEAAPPAKAAPAKRRRSRRKPAASADAAPAASFEAAAPNSPQE